LIYIRALLGGHKNDVLTTYLCAIRPNPEPIPFNTLAELYRDMERRRLVIEQIRQVEDARLECLKQAPKAGPNVMVRLLARVIGVGIVGLATG
jgi:hypothetical protein